MDDAKNKIVVYTEGSNEPVAIYDGNYFLYREDFIKEGCVHFRDSNGKHHRVYGGTVIVDEE